MGKTQKELYRHADALGISKQQLRQAASSCTVIHGRKKVRSSDWLIAGGNRLGSQMWRFARRRLSRVSAAA
jgi:hypothetical protein